MYRHYRRNNEKLIDAKIDWGIVVVYLLLVIFGWFSIYSSTYSGEDAAFYDIDYRYGMQLVWIGISLVFSFLVMLVDIRYFHAYSYFVYVITLLLMILTLLIGKEVNGAKSWLGVGPFGIQSVEFMKIGVAFAVARLISSHDFAVKSQKSLSVFVVILLLPILLSLLQNDTGSAMVFLIFALVLYREGMSYGLFLFAFVIVLMFVLSFLVDRSILFVLIFLSSVTVFAAMNKDPKAAVRYVAVVVLLTTAMFFPLFLLGIENALVKSLLVSMLLTMPLLFIYKKIYFKSTIWNIVLIAILMMAFSFVVDFAFDNVLQPHQQVRILDLFGIQNDPRGASYNVAQSKIAIGSGGFTGKGFLQGTQTQYSYVPEQETDFIFCTVGEEEGFLGTAVVVVLFSVLICRLLLMGERADDSFVRGFCYSVAGVFLFHFVINISMTIGLFPVIGIPLPFFSYGGSSLLAFSLLLAIAVRLRAFSFEK